MNYSVAGSIWCRTHHESDLRRFCTSTSSHGSHAESLLRCAPSDSVLCHFLPSICPAADCLDGVVPPASPAPTELTTQPSSSRVALAMVQTSDGLNVHGIPPTHLVDRDILVSSSGARARRLVQHLAGIFRAFVSRLEPPADESTREFRCETDLLDYIVWRIKLVCGEGVLSRATRQ